MYIKGTKWFTEMGNSAVIGVVIVEFNPQEMKEFNRETPVNAFIGTGTPGADATDDVDKIVKGGARFPLAAARQLIFHD